VHSAPKHSGLCAFRKHQASVHAVDLSPQSASDSILENFSCDKCADNKRLRKRMERDTFLHPQGRVSPALTQQSGSADPRERAQLQSIFVCVFVLKMLTQFNFALLELPLVRLAEELVCQNLVGVDNDKIGESRCKSGLVQDETARIVGLKTTFDALPCRIRFNVAATSTNELFKVS
jgi:hypothetical protein